MSDSSLNSMPSRYSTPAGDRITPYGTPAPTTPNNVGQDVVKKETMPPVINLSHSKGAKHLDKSFSKNAAVDSMFFDSYTAATHAVGQAQWHPPTNDSTFPQTALQEQIIVRRIYDALCDIDSALDTENSPYRKRFVPTKDTCYQAWAVEACAWEVLQLVKNLHNFGLQAPIFDAHILADIGQTANWTFEQRIDVICRVVRNSKNVAVTLMKREKIWTIIGAPHKLYHSNLINTVSNKNRNEDVKNGRAQRQATVTLSRKRKAGEEGAKTPETAHEEMDPAGIVVEPLGDITLKHAELLLNIRGA